MMIVTTDMATLLFGFTPDLYASDPSASDQGTLAGGRPSEAGKWVQEQMGEEKYNLYKKYKKHERRGILNEASKDEIKANNEYSRLMYKYNVKQKRSSQQQQGESSRNQQYDTGVSQHVRPHYPGQQPSSHGYYYPKGEESWDAWAKKQGY